MISLAINYVVVLIFALFSRVHFTWRVILVPFSVLQLWILALGLTLIFSTMYAYFRDIAHIWEVLQQMIFYGMPIAQAIQDIRHNFIAPETQPTVWNQFGSWWVPAIPLGLTVVLIWVGVYVFRKNSKKFAEVM